MVKAQDMADLVSQHVGVALKMAGMVLHHDVRTAGASDPVHVTGVAAGRQAHYHFFFAKAAGAFQGVQNTVQTDTIVVGCPGLQGGEAQVDIGWTQMGRGAFHDEASLFFGVRPEHPLPVLIYDDRKRDDVGTWVRNLPLDRDQDLAGVEMRGKTW